MRTEAEAFIIALDVGAASVDDVVAWACSVIENSDHPHWAICELALCSKKYPPDLATYLREIPGAADVKNVRALVLRMLAEGLSANPTRADRIARSLYDLALDGQLDDSRLRELAWWSWDALDLADAGHITETRQQIVKQMQDALFAAASNEDGSDGASPA